MAQIQSIDRHTSADSAMEILDRDGVVIYENLLDVEVMDQVQADLDAYLARAHNGEGEFWGFKTKRFGALVAKSRTFAEQFAPNPQVLAVMDPVAWTTL